MSDNRHKAEKYGRKWVVVQRERDHEERLARDGQSPVGTFATCPPPFGEGNARLIAKLLNDHEERQRWEADPLTRWDEGEQPSTGMAACPFCHSIYLDGDEAGTCCEELRSDYEPPEVEERKRIEDALAVCCNPEQRRSLKAQLARLDAR